MKKFLMVFSIAFASVMMLCSFTVSSSVTLKNEDYGQSLFLYTDGTCVITTTSGGRGTGNYDLNRGSIFINWDNGNKQQGSYTMESNQLTSVYIEGVRYSRRIVVPRR